MTIQADKELPKIEKMIYRLAWKFTHAQFPFEDARQEAFMAYVKACETFDETRGMKFSTYVYFKVKNHLITRVTKDANKQVFYFEPEQIFRAIEGNQLLEPKELTRWQDMLQELSRDAREVIALIVDTPHDLIGDASLTPKALLKRALERVRFERGLDQTDTEIILTEIKYGLKDALA